MPARLWFAFKFLPLQYLRQRSRVRQSSGGCCDLLSNSYLCSICDSSFVRNSVICSVVICFQILTFAVSATACLLTFASQTGCDLLSNSYLCSICDSIVFVGATFNRVVICFQILTFAVSATAPRNSGISSSSLWFAFKFLPLQYLRQPNKHRRPIGTSCDLLSNSYLCSICDSNNRPATCRRKVVICFQILTFAVSATALFTSRPVFSLLWFAFKFLPLQYLRQLKHHKQLNKRSLEHKTRKEKMAAVKKLLFNKPEFFCFRTIPTADQAHKHHAAHDQRKVPYCRTACPWCKADLSFHTEEE